MTLREFIMNESCCGKACKGEFDAAKDFDEKIEAEEPEVKDDAEKDGEEFEFVAKIKVNAADADEAKAKLDDALADFDAKIKAKKAEKEDKEEDEEKPAKKFKACPACGKNPCECK